MNMAALPVGDAARPPGRSALASGRSGSVNGPRRRRTYSALVAPSILLLLLVNGYPAVYAVVQSVRNGSLIAAGDFVGAQNYTTLFSNPDFWAAARFTVLFTVVGVLGSWLVGLGFALLLRHPIPGRSFFKVLLLLPWIVPVVVSSTSWNWLVATPQSVAPRVLSFLGFENTQLLADPTLAIVTVLVFKVWGSFPFMMMMSSAALSSIDPGIYEAARMDGASARRELMSITLPLIARTTLVSWILMTIFSVNDFPTIFLLTGGGPMGATTSLVVLAYHTVFLNFQTGPGAAIALMMSLVLIVVAVVLFRRIQKAARS